MAQSAMQSPAMSRIHGEAWLNVVPDMIEDATLVLQVEDSGRADAPATVLVEHRIRGISRSLGNADPVQFALVLPRPMPPGSAWSLRARLCRDMSAGPQHGDYVSTQHYPLSAAAGGRPLRIMLERLG